MRSTYRIIKKDFELDRLIQYCLESGEVSIDFETNARPRYHRDFLPTILGVSFQPGSGWIIPLAHNDSPFKHRWKSILKKFSESVIMNPQISKIAWNLGFEYGIFHKYGFNMKGVLLDAMLAKYLLDETRPNDLKSMVDKLLPEFSGYELANTPSSKASPDRLNYFWSNVPLEELSKYCALDCDTTYRLHLHFENRLISNKLYHLYRSFYMVLVKILSQNYARGVKVDRSWITYLDKKYTNLIKNIELEIMDIPEVFNFSDAQIESRIDSYIDQMESEIDGGNLSETQIAAREDKIDRVEAGEPGNKKERALFEPVNLNSSKQMINLLYEHEDGFNFDVLKKTDSGAPSTSEETLVMLKPQDESGFISKLLELRGLSKLKTTYITNILTDHLYEDDTIHPSYLPHATVSGRFGSRNPNFQNIPRVTTNPDIKKYIVAPKDHFFLEIDGSQMELRAAAEMFSDKAMIDIFKRGQNIHAATAARIYDKDYEVINKARKDHTHPLHEEMVRYHKTGKVLNFTIFYGAEGKKVSEFVTERTGHYISPKDGDDLIEAWFETFPGAAKGIKQFRAFAKTHGYVKSPIGRKRRLPILLDKANYRFRKGEWNEALRQSVNAPIQGFASDLTQWGNINIYEDWLRGRIPNYQQLLSTVHDSLEYPVHKSQVHTLVPHLTKLAASLRGLQRFLGYKFKKVDMKFSAELGITWGHAEEYNPKIDYFKKYDDDIKDWENLKKQLTNE